MTRARWNEEVGKTPHRASELPALRGVSIGVIWGFLAIEVLQVRKNHVLNFIGGIDERNREVGWKERIQSYMQGSC